jgi:SAM-dependent methyltransferase
MADPYTDGTYLWWHLGRPSPELLAADAEGWLGPPGVALDLGCGLATETGFLAASGWQAIGLDLSATALQTAAALQTATGADQDQLARSSAQTCCGCRCRPPAPTCSWTAAAFTI